MLGLRRNAHEHQQHILQTQYYTGRSIAFPARELAKEQTRYPERAPEVHRCSALVLSMELMLPVIVKSYHNPKSYVCAIPESR